LESVPQPVAGVPAQVVPVSFHVTPLPDVSPPTSAVKLIVPPTSSEHDSVVEPVHSDDDAPLGCISMLMVVPLPPQPADKIAPRLARAKAARYGNLFMLEFAPLRQTALDSACAVKKPCSLLDFYSDTPKPERILALWIPGANSETS
jgi:hypothetical protein